MKGPGGGPDRVALNGYVVVIPISFFLVFSKTSSSEDEELSFEFCNGRIVVINYTGPGKINIFGKIKIQSCIYFRWGGLGNL